LGIALFFAIDFCISFSTSKNPVRMADNVELLAKFTVDMISQKYGDGK